MTFQISRGRRQLQFAEPFPCDQHERDGSMKSSMSKREAKDWRHREDLLRIENFRNRSGERRDCPPNRKTFHLRCGKHAGGSQCGRQGEIYECGNRNGRPDTAQSIKDRSPGERSSRLFLCIPLFCIKRDRERTSNALSRPQKFRTFRDHPISARRCARAVRKRTPCSTWSKFIASAGVCSPLPPLIPVEMIDISGFLPASSPHSTPA